MDIQNRWTICLVACIGSVLMAAESSADGPKGTAVIKGKVVFEGTPPKMKKLSMGADAVCVKAHKKPVPAQGQIVYKKQDNAVPYVFVYVKKGISGKYDPPEKPVALDQNGCMYKPHVLGMVVGQGLDIINSDPVNHNIHSLARKNPAFNFAQPNKGMIKNLRSSATFNKQEVMIKIKCDVHAWMSCYVGVLKHPFFDVTKSHEDTKNADERGTFEIKDLPAGDYVLEAWHEKFGKVTQKVSVNDGETKEIEFKIGSKSARAPTARTVELASVARQDIHIPKAPGSAGGALDAANADSGKAINAATPSDSVATE